MPTPVIKLPTGANHTPAPDHVPNLAARARLDLMQASTSCDWHKAAPVDGDMLGNDTSGCCVEAWDFQEERLRLANAMGSAWKPTKTLVWGRYSKMTGFSPTTGQPDVGTDTAADTADLCTHGLQINDQLLDIPHWAILDPANVEHMKLAIEYCGAVAWTLNLPKAWQSLDWSLTPGTGPEWEPGSWEPGASFHRVGSGKFDGDWFTARTYGRDLPVHPDAVKLYVVAAEVRISRRWLTATGLTPSGLDFDALMADRARLAA